MWSSLDGDGGWPSELPVAGGSMLGERRLSATLVGDGLQLGLGQLVERRPWWV